MCLPAGLSQDVLEAGFSLLPIKNPAAHTGQRISPQVPSRYFRDCISMKVSDSVSSQELLPSSACFV